MTKAVTDRETINQSFKHLRQLRVLVNERIRDIRREAASARENALREFASKLDFQLIDLLAGESANMQKLTAEFLRISR